MSDVVYVRGVRELQRALRDVDNDLGPELRKGLNEVAEVVLDAARPLVPTRSGRARASMKVGSTQRAAAIKVGGTKAPYFAWLDFGGRTGRRKSVKRAFVSGGRYIYPTLRRKRADVEDALFDVLARLVQRAGL